MLKKILLGLFLVIILVFGGLTYYVSTLDWNTYKSKIADKFLEITGKEIDFAGSLNVSLFPEPHIIADNVSVYNQGDHIEEKLMEQIWIPFYRVDRSRVRDRKGTGLGLSICREILLRHNSRYGVHNVNDGVEFYFWLPLADPTKY